MPSNKNQHYIPKFYFRLFSRNKITICTYNLSHNIFIEHATIKGQCSKNYFYGKNTKIETTFSWLEGLANSKIRSIIQNKSLSCFSNEEIAHLKSHILFQHGRTKYAKDREEDMANYMLDLLKPKRYSDAKEAGEDISWESIKNTKIKLNLSNTLFVSMMSGILLIDLNVCLLENKSKIDFIFSDNPPVFFNSFFNYKHPGGTTGVASTGLQIFYPISSKFMLFLYDPNFYLVHKNHLKLNKNKDVQRLNGLQILNCDNNLYFEDFAMKDKILERFNQLKSKRKKERIKHEILGSRIAEDGTYRKLLRTSSPKLHYKLEKLSFLKHKINPTPYGARNPQLVKINRKVLDAVDDGKITSMEDLSNFLRSLEKNE